jgi:hypothetical protein
MSAKLIIDFLYEDVEVEENVQDLAMDFVEEELGRYYFLDNWEFSKRSGDALPRIERWLASIDQDPALAKSVYTALEGFHSKNYNWTN